ncbi:MAG: hypothetical protein JRI77_16000 [Deltaproteobacteria bacterium]|nr:hypothetical protein [Deltaproteobacteria bacterium]
MESSKIEIIPGRNRLLLVAPHGHMKDDENTGLLTREIAQAIKCYAIINETFKKPTEGPDPVKQLIDLNRKDQVEKYLREEFLEPLSGFVNEIIKRYGSCLILWIHGIEDGNINSDSLEQGVPSADILVGIGQGRGDRHTASKETVEQLIQYLRENVVKSIIAAMAKEESGYCGYDLKNMNQYFREKYDLLKLESIQLEIKFTGFRDKNSIPNTAKALSKAFEKMAAPAFIMQMENIVDEAYKNLMDIFSKHFKNAMIEAGQYLIKTFYGGDIEKARRKELVENISFYQLLKRLNPQESGGPSKSWVYNAINLAIQEHDLSNFSNYRKLNLSHQVLLLPIRDIKDKKRLINEIVKKNLTVAQLRKEIKKVRNNKIKNEDVPKTLKRIIGNPKILFSEENKSAIKMKALLELDINSLEGLKEKAKAKRDEIEDQIRELKDFSKNYERLFKKVDKAITKKWDENTPNRKKNVFKIQK